MQLKDDDNSIKKSIINQVTEQFSEYDHHNQKLFVQFFSAVFVVLIGYAFVFANQQFLLSDGHSATSKFTLMHLLSVYVVAQIILIFLSTLILNIGYCFRRDQLTLFNIRKLVFSDDQYRAIFGSRVNSPLNKGFLKDSYLPTFNALFFRFVILVQSTLFVTIVIAQESSGPYMLDFVRNHRISYIYFLSFPILINLSEYVRFFIKYKVKVDSKSPIGESINRSLTLVQEGWATLIPIFLLIELLLTGFWENILVIIVEVFSWTLLTFFLFYLLKVKKLYKRRQ